MMLGPVDFCHSALNTRVKCSKLTVDGNEVTSLVSPSSFSNRGFICESFVYPPVNVSLMFACNIDIDCIIINGKVGSHGVSGFEIYTFSSERNAEAFNSRWDTRDRHVLATDNFDRSRFTQIGNIKMNRNIESRKLFCLKNKDFKLKNEYKHVKPMNTKSTGQDLLWTDIRTPRNWKHMSDVSHLTIRITSCIGSPALKWIEIWGQPSHTCQGDDIAKVLQIHREITAPYQSQHNSNITQGIKGKGNVGNSASDTVSTENIPNDFLDPITFEVMMLPMLLPSGHSIDQSTLEKHTREESSWGRPPSDPFTGLRFTDSSKPVANVKLKLRIDNFLLTRKSYEIDPCPERTLGSASEILDKLSKKKISTIACATLGDASRAEGNSCNNLRPGFSLETLGSVKQQTEEGFDKSRISWKDTDQLYPPHMKRAKKSFPIDHQFSNDQNDGGAPSTGVKRQGSKVDFVITKKYKQDTVDYNSAICRPSSSVTSATIKPIENKVSFTNLNSSAREQAIAENLDSTLDNLLSNLPSYCVKETKEKSFNIETWRNCSTNCVFCLQTKETQSIYTLECGDTACRNCLMTYRTSSNKITCKICGKESSSRNVVKSHV